jgi:CrcB protein
VQWLVVAIGGATGATLRYGVGRLAGSHGFPWVTLGINVLGCFALAWLLAGPTRHHLSETTTVGLAIGLLGAFTTYSTFGWEAYALARTDRLPAAAAYVAASLVLGIGASALGYLAGRGA